MQHPLKFRPKLLFFAKIAKIIQKVNCMVGCHGSNKLTKKWAVYVSFSSVNYTCRSNILIVINQVNGLNQSNINYKCTLKQLIQFNIFYTLFNYQNNLQFLIAVKHLRIEGGPVLMLTTKILQNRVFPVKIPENVD